MFDQLARNSRVDIFLAVEKRVREVPLLDQLKKLLQIKVCAILLNAKIRMHHCIKLETLNPNKAGMVTLF